MANRLQRIMMMDQMFQNRNMPQQGMQSVFNPTTGTFVNVPFQTDPNFKGRRTVMTPSGPQVLPGFQGQENPYRALGRTARNLLGNLFSRGQRRRQNRKADQSLQSQEEILRERYRQAGPDGQMNTEDDILPEFVTKAPTASPVVVEDGKGEITFTQERMPGVFKEAGSYENRIKQLMENQGINRGEAERNQAEAIRRGMDLDNSGYVDDSEEFAFNNPMTAGQPLEIPAFRSGREERLREIEERINRPIVTSQNLPTFDVSRVRGQTAKLSQEDKNIENFLPAGVTSDGRIVNGQTTTKATREQLRTALQDRKSLEGVDQRTKDLRGEFRRATDQFSKIDQAFGRLQGSLTGTGAGDLSLIFQYMKILDPGSTVREGEFATAQNSGGVDDRVRSLYNQIVEGARLSASQRIDFYERAKDLYKAEKEGYDLNVATYNDLAEKSKVNKNLVTYDRANAAATGDKINIILSSLNESELNSLTNEELKRLGGQDLVNRVAKFKQGESESSADKFGFSTLPQVTIEKIANQDRQSLLNSYGQEFVDALEAELIRRDEQK